MLLLRSLKDYRVFIGAKAGIVVVYLAFSDASFQQMAVNEKLMLLDGWLNVFFHVCI